MSPGSLGQSHGERGSRVSAPAVGATVLVIREGVNPSPTVGATVLVNREGVSQAAELL
jgi:hypothetical protein